MLHNTAIIRKAATADLIIAPDGWTGVHLYKKEKNRQRVYTEKNGNIQSCQGAASYIAREERLSTLYLFAYLGLSSCPACNANSQTDQTTFPPVQHKQLTDS